MTQNGLAVVEEATTYAARTKHTDSSIHLSLLIVDQHALKLRSDAKAMPIAAQSVKYPLVALLILVLHYRHANKYPFLASWCLVLKNFNIEDISDDFDPYQSMYRIELAVLPSWRSRANLECGVAYEHETLGSDDQVLIGGKGVNPQSPVRKKQPPKQT